MVRAGFPRERQVHGGHGEDSNALRAALARDWERGGRLHKTFQDPTRGWGFHPEEPWKDLSSKRVMTFAICKCPQEATIPPEGEEPERGGKADRGAEWGPWDGVALDFRRRMAGRVGGQSKELMLVLISCKLPLDSARTGYSWELGRKFGKCKKLSIYL